MKGFYITIKNGLLEPKHVEKIGNSIWLFLWLLDKMTIINHETGEGIVLGGKPVKFDEVKKDLGITEKTYSRWVAILESSKYISTIRAPHGLCFKVHNSFKVFGKNWAEKGQKCPSDRTKMSDEKSPETEVIGQKCPSDRTKMSESSDIKGGCNKTIQRQYKDNTLQPTKSVASLKPKKKEKTPKKEKSNHKIFIEFWDDMVKRTRGMKPIYTGGDMRNLKRILDFGIEERTLEQISLFFLADYSFKSFSPSISTLCSAGIINGLLNRSKNGNDPEFWRKMSQYMEQYLKPRDEKIVTEIPERKVYDPNDDKTFSTPLSMADAMKKILDKYNQNNLEK